MVNGGVWRGQPVCSDSSGSNREASCLICLYKNVCVFCWIFFDIKTLVYLVIFRNTTSLSFHPRSLFVQQFCIFKFQFFWTPFCCPLFYFHFLSCPRVSRSFFGRVWWVFRPYSTLPSPSSTCLVPKGPWSWWRGPVESKTGRSRTPKYMNSQILCPPRPPSGVGYLKNRKIDQIQHTRPHW